MWLIATIVAVTLLIIAIIVVAVVALRDDDKNREWRPFGPIPNAVELQRAVDAYLTGGDELVSIRASYGDIMDWDVSRITDFSNLFNAARNPSVVRFNRDISLWNVTNGLNFSHTFAGARDFNQDLSFWTMKRAKSIDSMFQGAVAFRQNLCAWGENLPSDVVAESAFDETSCPLSGKQIDMSAVPPGPFCYSCEISSAPTLSPTAAQTSRLRCFENEQELTQAVDNYMIDPTGGLTADKYGHPIGNWCVDKISKFARIFATNRNPAFKTFNEDISGWNVSSATTMVSML